MGEGDIVHQPIKMRPLAELQLIFLSQEAKHRIGRRGNIAGPQDELSPVASGQYDDLFDSFRTHQLIERFQPDAPD